MLGAGGLGGGLARVLRPACSFFGEVTIDGATEAMTVALEDLTGATLYSVELAPG